MKLHYNYIFIILSILLLLSFLSVIYIQKDPTTIDTNTVEFFENKNQNSETENKDNLEIKPSNDTINKKGSNLVIDFIDPPGKHNTMENLFMKWTKKTPGSVTQSLIYNNKIYGLGLDSQIWEFPLSGNTKTKWKQITNNGEVKLFRINNNTIYGLGTNNKIYKRLLSSNPKSNWELMNITSDWFDILNNVIWTRSGFNMFTYENNKLIHKTPGAVSNITIVGNLIYGTGSDKVVYKRELTDPVNVKWKKVGGNNIIQVFGYEKSLYALQSNGLIVKLVHSNKFVNVTKNGSVKSIFIYKNTIYGVGLDNSIYTHPLSLSAVEGFSNGGRGPNTIIPDLIND